MSDITKLLKAIFGEDAVQEIDAAKLEMILETERSNDLLGALGQELAKSFEYVSWTLITSVFCRKCKKPHIVRVGTEEGNEILTQILHEALEALARDDGKTRRNMIFCEGTDEIH